MESGQSLSTCIGMGRDEKVRWWVLQLCFGLFVLYKIEHLKDVAREANERFRKIVGSFYDC
jgi:hypothetical protein